VRFRDEDVTSLPPHRLVRKGLARTFQAITVYGQRSVYENCLRERGIAVVVIDHNMRFMRDICDRIFVMHHGQELARGTPDQVLSNPNVIQAYLGRAYAKPQA